MRLFHHIALRPTYKQRRCLAKASGTARFAYDWALAERNRRCKSGEQVRAHLLDTEWNCIKREHYPRLVKVGKDAAQHAIHTLGAAFTNFFQGRFDRPTFKKKGTSRDSFYVANGRFSLRNREISLPKIGRIRLREALRVTGKIMSATVSRSADRWYVAVQVEVPDELLRRTRTADGVIGVDLGLRHAAVLSTGEKIEPPKPLQRHLRRFQMQSRALSRKRKGSHNRRKQARRHARLVNVRADFWHKRTTRLCRETQAVGIEDLNVSGLARDSNLARHFNDVGLGRLRRFMQYKSQLYDTRFVVVDRFYPSSKVCGECGEINWNLKLSDRSWVCACSAQLDRDVNAAQDFARPALPTTCGEVTPGRGESQLVQARKYCKSRSHEAAAARAARRL